MKAALLFLSALTLTATMAMAQAAPHSNFAPPAGNQMKAATSSPSSSSDLRGCLEGTKGNYTLTDHQGKVHKVAGDNHALYEDAGHEVDLTGKSGTGSFQETGISDIASRCWNFHLN